jgi:pyruvate kinase
VGCACYVSPLSSESVVSTPDGAVVASLESVARELVGVLARLRNLETEMRLLLAEVGSDRRESAKNLVHYVALRQSDLRDLQDQLSKLGLSSLGRSESCVMAGVHAACMRVHESLAFRGNQDAQRELAGLLEEHPTTSPDAAKRYLHHNTQQLLGPRPLDRHIYIMVTAPSAAEADRAWMAKMLDAGMNVLRINCAHEGEREWRQVLDALVDARTRAGRECRVLMDLAGPKIRTGPVAGARHIATWKPFKDDIGEVTASARVVLRRSSAARPESAGPTLLVEDKAFAKVRAGDQLRFRDARGKKIKLRIHSVESDELVGFSKVRAYVLEQVDARLYRQGEHEGNVTIRVGDGEGGVLDVKTGDALVLTRRAVEGKPPERDGKGRALQPGIVACTLPAALKALEVGHRVLFDDGRILAVVEKVEPGGDDFLLRVTRTQKETAKLRSEKGINLPDTLIAIPSLTEEDLRALSFVAKHADAVSLSFVRTPDDVRLLHAELDRLGRSGIGVVLKIETRAGFENLPRLLLEGLRRSPLAIMIARGDLAVEIGFERLAEVQEEILWLCEAAHVPAIWATQVLDTLARTGVPSRAEVTDAAASVAAECVMLNKGPFVDEAVAVLADILRRMEQHRYKKRSLFRKLQVSNFNEPTTDAGGGEAPGEAPASNIAQP